MKEKLWDYKQAKSILAICIIGIMFHHIAQKTCAPWLKPEYVRHGLDFFVPIGYLFVAVFFFSSGYGLMECFRSRENYLEGFIRKHFSPILLEFAITEALFWIYGAVTSPYTWYVFTILYSYLVFYLAFRYCKKTSLSMKKLADELAEDYTVIVPDYLGSGFSDNPCTERSIANITKEIHEALQNLNVRKPYVLMPEYISGIYAQYYAEKYPDEVKMIINVDAESAGSINESADLLGISVLELMRQRIYEAETNNIEARIVDFLGWDEFFWPVYEDSYVHGLSEDDSALVSYIFF